MDSFDKLLTRLKEIEEARNKPAIDEQWESYYTGVWWGLIMALQEIDMQRWLEWHFEQTLLEERKMVLDGEEKKTQAKTL